LARITLGKNDLRQVLLGLAPALGGESEGVVMTLEPELAALVSEAAWNLGLGPAEVARALAGGPAHTYRVRALLAAEIVRLLIDDERPELSEAARVQLGLLEGDDRDEDE
jgi:hypothetical protein